MNSYFDQVAKIWDEKPMRTERAAETARQIRQVRFTRKNTLVDFGCGTGLLGIQLKDDFQQIHLADASKDMLDMAQEKISAAGLKDICMHHVYRLSDLPDTYSAIATLMTLHHISDIKQFFSDAYGVLEAHGKLMIADLFQEDGSFHQHHDGFDGHNGFDTTILTSIAEDAGFEVQSAEAYYTVRREGQNGETISYPLFFFVAEKS